LWAFFHSSFLILSISAIQLRPDIKRLSTLKKVNKIKFMETGDPAFAGKNIPEEKLKSFLESAPDGMVVVNHEGYIEFVNAQTEKIFGYSRNELLGQKIEILIPIRYENLHKQHRAEFKKHPKVRAMAEGMELFGRTKEGKEIPVEISLSPIETSEGLVISATIRDVTEKKKIEQELKKSNERYDYVTKATSDAIWDWDIQTDTIYRGKTYKSLFGYEDILSTIQFRLDHIHPEDRERVGIGLKKALNGDAERWQDEYLFQCADGRYKRVLDKGFIIRSPDGAAMRMIGAMQDITEQRQLQIQLKQEEQRIKEEIMQAIINAQEKERYEISHELHDNVNQILTTCKLLLEAEAKENKSKYLQQSMENLQRAIDELRNISHRLNPATLQYIGLQGAIDDLVTKINNTGKVTISFTSSLRSEEKIDEEVELALFRIVQEQINNILKHSDAYKVLIDLTFEKGKLKLTITDDGKGHDLQIKKHGLGLKNIFNRAEFHKGFAEIFSEPGKGFMLQVEIPQ
jgi:PAS domain S-box-containing protein